MYASFTVCNGSAYAIKDFSVAIELFANSGTLVQTIASNTIYELVDSKKVHRVDDARIGVVKVGEGSIRCNMKDFELVD